MKKIILASVFGIFATGAFAQNAALDAQLREAQCKSTAEEIAKGEKATADPKKGVKPATWTKLAQSYVDMVGNCGKDSMASEKAYNTYQKALEVDAAAGGKMKKEIDESITKLYTPLMGQGANFYNAKNLTGALKLFKLATVVNPKDSIAALYTGIVAQNLKDNATAIKAFSDFLDLGGKDPSIFYSLSELYKAEKNNAKAAEVLKRGIAVHPKDKDLQGSLVNLRLSSGNQDEAINEMRVLVEKDPNNVQNLVNLAILVSDKNKEEGLKLYKQALAKDPKNFDANFNMGVSVFNDAVEIKKKVDNMDMKTYQKEGKAIEEQVCAKFSEAKPYFDVCKESKPNDEELMNTYKNLTTVLEQCASRKK
jgi:tetratricopeptide (TPR) repeat protein